MNSQWNVKEPNVFWSFTIALKYFHTHQGNRLPRLTTTLLKNHGSSVNTRNNCDSGKQVLALRRSYSRKTWRTYRNKSAMCVRNNLQIYPKRKPSSRLSARFAGTLAADNVSSMRPLIDIRSHWFFKRFFVLMIRFFSFTKKLSKINEATCPWNGLNEFSCENTEYNPSGDFI